MGRGRGSTEVEIGPVAVALGLLLLFFGLGGGSEVEIEGTVWWDRYLLAGVLVATFYFLLPPPTLILTFSPFFNPKSTFLPNSSSNFF